MPAEKNKAFIHQFYKYLQSGDFNTVIDECFAEDFLGHYNSLDRNGYKQITKDLRAAYPDMLTTVEDIIAENDKVVVRLQVSAKKKSFSAIEIFRIADGKIVELWAHSDSFF